jgi:hypothetical protein
MITDSLPYLIQLIKKNILLHTLVVHGNWHHINLGKYEHEVMGQTLIIQDFPLSDADKFEVNFSVQDDISDNKGKMTALSLITREPKYFDSAEFYFDDNENRGKNKNPLVKAERKHSKDLGVFKIYDDAVSPAFVTITKNENYGYMIYIRFYTNFDAAYKIKRQVDEDLEKSAGWF